MKLLIKLLFLVCHKNNYSSIELLEQAPKTNNYRLVGVKPNLVGYCYMLKNMLFILAILFCLLHEGFTSAFEDCTKQNGKEIVIGVCVPDRYDKMTPPNESPVTVQIDLKINGLKVIYFLIILFRQKQRFPNFVSTNN